MMEGMRILQTIFIILVLLYHYGIEGQVTPPLSTAAALGDDVSLVCTTEETNPIFSWVDGDTGNTIFAGSVKDSGEPEHFNVQLGTSNDPQRSVLNIIAIEYDDDGNYTCRLSGQPLDNFESTKVTVEVGSPQQDMIFTSNDTHYQAICEARDSKPAETITWFLNDVEQTDGIVVTILDATPPLSSRRSTFTFLATLENYNAELRCVIGGHQVTRLNREESTSLDDHNPPETDGIVIGFSDDGTSFVVSCNMNNEVDAAIPAMDTFYIYENGTLISKPLSDSTVTVTEPEQDTEYMCVGGNYLGNTTATRTYQPGRTTTPPPTTDMMTSPGPNDGNETGGLSAAAALSVGEIVGIVIGAILGVIIIVLVIYFVWKKGTCSGNPGFSLQGLFTSCNCCLPSTAASSTKKHGSSAVGTSNGSEKNDVAAPLNSVNEVVTEDKIKPVAAPRDQGSIQHTTDNPGQAEYAMVDRKKPGGDMPDTRGPGQKDPQGMLYADLDLSASAGHTEKKVPQNKDDVVVYSSILV